MTILAWIVMIGLPLAIVIGGVWSFTEDFRDAMWVLVALFATLIGALALSGAVTWAVLTIWPELAT